MRSYVRAWRPLWRWWTGTGNSSLPLNPEAVLTYLEQRASEPCVPSVLRRTRAALVFYEEAAGLPTTARSTLCGTWQTHSAHIAAAEALVVDIQSEAVLRCYAFWRCLGSWAALRFSGHRGLSPAACRVTEGAFKAVLTRTKTTGADKKIQSIRFSEIPVSLGKVRMQICRSDRPLPSPRSETHTERRTPVVRRCSWQIVEGTQPTSVPHQLHRLSQLPNQLARRYWRLVTRAVASLRAHHEATDWNDAKKSSSHAACR